MFFLKGLEKEQIGILKEHLENIRKNIVRNQAEIDYSDLSSRWVLPDRYYSVIEQIEPSTSVLILILDTSPFIESYQTDPKYHEVLGQDTEKQLVWLEKTLSESDADWKITVGHHPVYTADSPRGGTPELLDAFKPVFDDYNTHVYLCGHNHNLQHLKPEGPVHYFVSGGGSRVNNSKENEFSLFSKGISGFMAVSLASDRMQVQFIDHMGILLYTTIINRDNESF